MGSDRNFGLVFAGFFLLLGLMPLIRGGNSRWPLFLLALIFAVLALFKPAVLTPINRLWFKLGIGLSKVMTPVVMGFVFFCVFAPIGSMMRILGKGPVRL